MHRRPLLDLLDRYAAHFPGDAERTDPLRRFVRARADCFERSCPPGHITASAWIVSHDHRRALLTHHRKLDRWLQLGGHADGNPDPLDVALCEAREESGMHVFHVVCPGAGSAPAAPPLPLDVDIHPIPARAGEPEHLHHDVRYLLVAAPGQALVRSDESHDLRWFEADELARLPLDASVRRLAAKARLWL